MDDPALDRQQSQLQRPAAADHLRRQCARRYIGWYLLLVISAITIVGWAWVVVAQMRWICRNISGTHREILFNATGLEMLWRTLVFVIACVFIIPIPWMLRWYAQWYVSQFELVDRAA